MAGGPPGTCIVWCVYGLEKRWGPQRQPRVLRMEVGKIKRGPSTAAHYMPLIVYIVLLALRVQYNVPLYVLPCASERSLVSWHHLLTNSGLDSLGKRGCYYNTIAQALVICNLMSE